MKKKRIRKKVSRIENESDKRITNGIKFRNDQEWKGLHYFRGNQPIDRISVCSKIAKCCSWRCKEKSVTFAFANALQFYNSISSEKKKQETVNPQV